MGGAEYQAHVLAEEFGRRAGLSVYYLARRVPKSIADHALPYSIRRLGSSSGIRRHAVFFDAPNLAKTLHELQPALIYQQMKQSYAAVCAWYARRMGIPFFLHIASEWDLNPSWLPFGLNKHAGFNMIEAVAGNWGLRKASHIIVQTKAQEHKLQSRFGREAAVLVRNFQPVPASLAERSARPMRVLWVGNIKPVKRPELFVALAKLLAHRSDLQFDMVGRPWDHPDAQPFMQQLAATPNLRFHGELPLDRVNELMSGATFYVNTSEHEGFPNTYVQAWAHGAVLLSIAVDPYDGMDDLGIGFLTGTLERMKALIEELSDQPERRRAIAERGWHFAQESHSLAVGARLVDTMLEVAKATTVAGNARKIE